MDVFSGAVKMNQKCISPNESSSARMAFLRFALVWALLASSLAVAETPDHSAHEAMGHEASVAEDPHAHHRAMLQKTSYKRSEHDYKTPDLKLVGMDGEDTTLLTELNCGKPVMINFVFTTCTTICPVMSATFTQVQSLLGSDSEKLRMISFSIDPEYDTPERLREYAGRFDAGPQWRFMTGSLADLIAVQKAFDVYRGNKMNHEPTTLMRKSEGDPWVRIDGIASAADIVKEYERLIAP
jgi:protein SCO1/2